MAVLPTAMTPGTRYQVTFKGSDGRTLTAVVDHALTVGSLQFYLKAKSGAIGIDVANTSTAVASVPANTPLSDPH
jgi:hypothetical protein